MDLLALSKETVIFRDHRIADGKVELNTPNGTE